MRIWSVQANRSKHVKIERIHCEKVSKRSPPPPAPLDEVLNPLSVVFLLLQCGRAQRILCMTLWPHKPWLESLDGFKPSLFGRNGLWNSVVLNIRVIDPALIASRFCFRFQSQGSWPCDLGYMPRTVFCLLAEDPPL